MEQRNKKISEELNNGVLEKLANRVKGNVALLWGDPMVGKSLLCLHLSKYFKKPVLLLVDNNYPSEYFSINPSLQIVKIDNFQKLNYWLDKLTQDNEADLVIIDSVTTLASDVVGRSPTFMQGDMSPRVFLVLRYLYDVITRKSAVLKEKGKTVIIIAHSSYDWKANMYKPSIGKLATRNVDLTIRLYIDEEGERRLEIKERKYEGGFEPPKF